MTDSILDICLQLNIDTSEFTRGIDTAMSEANRATAREMDRMMVISQKKLAEWTRMQSEALSNGVLPEGMTQSMWRVEERVGEMSRAIIDHYNTVMKYGNQYFTVQNEQYTKLQQSIADTVQTISTETSKIRVLEKQIGAMEVVRDTDPAGFTEKDYEDTVAQLREVQYQEAKISSELGSAQQARADAFTEERAKAWDAEIERLTRESKALQLERINLEASVNQWSQYYNALQTLGTTPVDEQSYNELLARHTAEQQKLNEALATRAHLEQELSTTQQYEKHYNVIPHEAVEEMKELFLTMNTLSQQQSGIAELEYSFHKLTAQSSALATELAELKDVDFYKEGDTETLEQMSARLKELTALYVNLQQARTASVGTADAGFVMEDVDGMKVLTNNVEEATVSFEGATYSAKEFDQEMDMVRFAIDVLNQRIGATEEYDKLQSSINDVILKIQELRGEASQPIPNPVGGENGIGELNRHASVFALTRTISMVGNMFKRLTGIDVTGITMGIRTLLRVASLDLKQVAGAIDVVRTKLAKLWAFMMANPWIALLTAVLALVVAIGVKVKQGIDKMKEAFDEAFKAIGDKLSHLKDSFKDLYATLIKGGAWLLTYFERLVYNGATYLWNTIKSLKSTVMEGLKDIAKWNKGVNSVNKALSNLTSSLNYVKASLATAFAPILTYIEPALTKILDTVAEAITYIGMFIATLTGADSYIKATRVQKDYAESLDETAKSADKAQGSLASFDKLNNLSDKKNDSDSKKLADYSLIDLKKVQLPSWMQDFYKMGEHLAQTLAKWLNKIDWDSIYEKAKKAGKGIADFINGFIGVKELPYILGKSLAGVINTFVYFMRSFFDTVDALGIGVWLQETIRSMLYNIDKEELGRMITDPINAIAEFIAGMMSGDIGKQLGKSFSTIFQSALDNLSWTDIENALYLMGYQLANFFDETLTPENFTKLGEALGNFIGSIFRFLGALFKNGDTKQWFESIATGINSFFENLPANEIEDTVNTIAIKLLDGIIAGLDKLDLDVITDKLAEMTDEIEFEEIAGKINSISQKLYDVVSAIWDTLEASGAIDGALQLVATFINEKIKWTDLFDKLLESLKKRAQEYFKNFNFWDFVKKCIGMNEDTYEFDSLDGYKKEDPRTTARGAFTGLWNKLTKNSKEATDNANASMDTMYANISDGALSGSNALTSMFNTFKEGTASIDTATADVNKFNNTLTETSQAFSKGVGTFKAKDLADGTFGTFVTYTKESILQEHSPSKVFEDMGKYAVEGFLIPFDVLPEDFKKIWTLVQNMSVTCINRMRTVVCNNLNIMVNNIKSIMQRMATTIGNSLGSTVNTVKTQLKNALESSISFDSITNSLSTVGKKWEGLWNGMAETTKNKANSVIESMNALLGGLEVLANTKADGTLKTGKESTTFPRIPKLAKGAVIPPNKQFLAMLGDQTQGTNIEAPLETIEQALRNVMATQNIHVTFDVQGDPNGMFKVMQRKSNEFNRRTGLPSFT